MKINFCKAVVRLCLAGGMLVLLGGAIRHVHADDIEFGGRPRRTTLVGGNNGTLRVGVAPPRANRSYTNAESVQALLDGAEDIGNQFGPKDALELIGDAENMTFKSMQRATDWQTRGRLAGELSQLRNARVKWELKLKYAAPRIAIETDDAAMRDFLPTREGQLRGPVQGDTLRGRLPELTPVDEVSPSEPSFGNTFARGVGGRVPGAAAAAGLGFLYEVDSGVPPEEAALDAVENAAPLLIPVVGEAYAGYYSAKMLYDYGQMLGAAHQEFMDKIDGTGDFPLLEERVREMFVPSEERMQEMQEQGIPWWFRHDTILPAY